MLYRDSEQGAASIENVVYGSFCPSPPIFLIENDGRPPVWRMC